MSVNIRYPNITALTDKEKLIQIKSYLHQLVDDLNYALSLSGTSGSGQTYEVQGGEISYYELKSLIMRETQAISSMLDDYVSKTELGVALEQAKQLETGSGNGWVYKKWSDGSYEMFGSFVVETTASGGEYGSMFCSNVFTIPTPFSIDSAVVSGSAEGYFMVANGDRAAVDAENNISFILLRPITFDSGMGIKVQLHVTGICNTGGTD